MIATVIFLAALAAAVAFWPQPTPKRFAPVAAAPAAEPQAPHPSCREALELVVEIRERLTATSTLDDKARQAIETLTLCILNGSDQP